MSAINIDPALQARLDQMAQSLSRLPEEIVNEAISEHLERLSEQKLEAEIEAFEKLYPTLKAHYPHKFVAVHNGQVVDADREFESLFLRIRSHFGDVPVLIRLVGNSPEEEWVFRSPQMEPGE